MLPILTIAVSLLVSMVLAQNCPSGYTYDTTFNKCALYYNETATGAWAGGMCGNIGGTMPSIHNAFMNTHFGSQAIAHFNDWSNVYVWLGGNVVNGTFMWSDNSMVDYTHFHVGTNITNTDFGCVAFNMQNYLWFLIDCTSKHHFACFANANMKE